MTKKGSRKSARRSASTSSAATQPTPETQPTQPTQETQTTQESQPTQPTQDREVKVESPEAKETEMEEAKPTQQAKDLNVRQKEVAKGASSSKPKPDDDEEEDPDIKPLIRRSKRDRSASKEPEKSPATRSAKRAKTTKAKEADTEYFEEKRSLEDLWKAAFPVGTEWGQLDEVYESKWDFSNLEKAFEKGGKLYGKKVYVFGCTESHPVPNNAEDKIVLVPAVVCVESSIPPSDKIGITSAQTEVEEIKPMKAMKMAWVPYIPLDRRDRKVDRVKFQIYILGCTQRRSAVKHLKDDRVKKFNSCLPYINNPYKEDESEQSTVVQITFPSEPPVVLQYDWVADNLEEFTNELIKQEEAALADQQDEFKEFVKEESDKARTAYEEAEQARETAREAAEKELNEETKAAYKEMKLYKFYPLPSPGTPDLSAFEKTSMINKYFGKADEVL